MALQIDTAPTPNHYITYYTKSSHFMSCCSILCPLNLVLSNAILQFCDTAAMPFPIKNRTLPSAPLPLYSKKRIELAHSISSFRVPAHQSKFDLDRNFPRRRGWELLIESKGRTDARHLTPRLQGHVADAILQ